MSTYWHISCINHRVGPGKQGGSSESINHGEKYLEELLRIRPALNDFWIEVWNSPEVRGWLSFDRDDYNQIATWLTFHTECDLVIVNEYGETLQEWRDKYVRTDSNEGTEDRRKRV